MTYAHDWNFVNVVGSRHTKCWRCNYERRKRKREAKYIQYFDVQYVLEIPNTNWIQYTLRTVALDLQLSRMIHPQGPPPSAIRIASFVASSKSSTGNLRASLCIPIAFGLMLSRSLKRNLEYNTLAKCERSGEPLFIASILCLNTYSGTTELIFQFFCFMLVTRSNEVRISFWLVLKELTSMNWFSSSVKVVVPSFSSSSQILSDNRFATARPVCAILDRSHRASSLL